VKEGERRGKGQIFVLDIRPPPRPSPDPYPTITTWKEVVQEEKQIRGVQEDNSASHAPPDLQDYTSEPLDPGGHHLLWQSLESRLCRELE
jgi:hypothetical protein